MQLLDNKMTRIGLVLAVALVLVYLVKSNESKMGQDAAMVVMAIVVLSALYGVFVINNEEAESFYQENSENLTDVSSEMTEAPVVDEVPLSVANNVEVNNTANTMNNNAANTMNNNAPAEGDSYGVKASEPLGQNEQERSVQDLYKTSAAVPDQCYPKDVLSSAELLPRDTDSTWAQSIPANQGSLTDQNFLNAGYHIGVNTVGQTLRNANRQLRSDPPCPRVKVSPFLQSTIEPDTNRRPFEMGA